MNIIKNWFKKRDVANLRTAVAAIRADFTGKPLEEAEAGTDPFALFEEWFADAVAHIRFDPNAMLLSTADSDGKPSSRVVLLKGFDERGFVFYTNYNSRKGSEIKKNDQVCLNFYWPELFRQIRIEGKAEKISAEESDAYFLSRPKGSNYSAMASPQSQRVSGRPELEKLQEEVKKRWDGKEELQRPDHWGGYRICTDFFEFWQGRTNRLHDRIAFERKDQNWNRFRLAP